MIRKLSISLLTIVALVDIVSQAQSLPPLTHHVREAIRTGEAQFMKQLPSDQMMQLDLVLPLSDRAGLDSFLKDVYDPASPLYRQFLTVPEFTERFGPSAGRL